MQEVTRQVIEALKRNAEREARDERLHKEYNRCFMYSKPVPDHIFVQCEKVRGHAKDVRSSFIIVIFEPIQNKFLIYFMCDKCTFNHFEQYGEYKGMEVY